jgi:hypothetical protein
MDDTLEPDQVREIGKQVAESQFAQELRDRINRVTRQRRLTVPSSSGPDATDPNIVASYLDNDLDPDAVADFEKRCLTSDVNLAEVKSVHEILSLLGQKMKVPDEARTRMYQLVKGREATAARRQPVARPVVKEPVTKPIQPWAMPEAPRRPWIERYGPAAACALLILLSIWAARESLKVPPAQAVATPAGAVAAESGPAPVATPAAEGTMVAAAGEATRPQLDTTPGTSPETPPAPAAEPAKPANTADLEKSKPSPPPVVPAGVAGLAEKPDGILLRYNEERREWDRLDKQTLLKVSDRILCLEPFRASIDVGKLRLVLVRETEIRILSQPSDPVPAIELVQGQIALRQPGSDALKVVFAKQPVTLEMASDSVFGIERVSLNEYAPGKPVTQPASLGILCNQGQVTVVVGEKRETLKPLNTALVSPAGRVGTGKRDSLPTWLTQAEPTPSESQVKDEFAKLFHADRPVLAEVVAAIEDERPEIKPLAVGALKALGDLSLLMPTLSRPNDRVARRATIGAIRSYMMQGPEASGRVRAAFDDEFGADLGGFAQHMLIGYTPEEASKPDLYTRLVELLSPDQDSVGLRELALDTLKRLTGRDDLGYDPDKPAGRGFDAWKDLVRRNELRIPPAPPVPGRALRTKGQR